MGTRVAICVDEEMQIILAIEDCLNAMDKRREELQRLIAANGQGVKSDATK